MIEKKVKKHTDSYKIIRIPFLMLKCTESAVSAIRDNWTKGQISLT